VEGAEGPSGQGRRPGIACRSRRAAWSHPLGEALQGARTGGRLPGPSAIRPNTGPYLVFHRVSFMPSSRLRKSKYTPLEVVGQSEAAPSRESFARRGRRERTAPSRVQEVTVRGPGNPVCEHAAPSFIRLASLSQAKSRTSPLSFRRILDQNRRVA